MRGFTEQVPEKGRVGAGDGGADVAGRVAETDREDLGAGERGEERGAEWENAAAVGRGAFWEDDDGAVAVLAEEGLEIDEVGVRRGIVLRGLEGAQDGFEEGDVVDEAGGGVGGGEDGVEDGGEVESVDWGGGGRCYNG